MVQIEPVLKAIRESYNPQTVIDLVPQIVKPDAIEKTYFDLYAEVGGSAALLNTRIINDAIKTGQVKNTTIEDLWADYIKNYIRNVGNWRIVSVTETSQNLAAKFIAQAIDEAMMEGESIYEAQQRIERYVEESWRKTDLFRADRIARTEVFTAYSLADYESARSYNIGLTKEWVYTSFAGKDPRPGHQMLNGVNVGMSEKFVNPVTNMELLHPHDFNGDASEVINCRCSMVYNPIV